MDQPFLFQGFDMRVVQLVGFGFNAAGVWKPKVRPLRFQKPHGGSDGLLFSLRQTSPPVAQFIGIFNFPHDQKYIS